MIGIDTATNLVHLNDSGTKDGKDEQVPLKLFLQAWATSDERVVVTTYGSNAISTADSGQHPGTYAGSAVRRSCIWMMHKVIRLAVSKPIAPVTAGSVPTAGPRQ